MDDKETISGETPSITLRGSEAKELIGITSIIDNNPQLASHFSRDEAFLNKVKQISTDVSAHEKMIRDKRKAGARAKELLTIPEPEYEINISADFIVTLFSIHKDPSYDSDLESVKAQTIAAMKGEFTQPLSGAITTFNMLNRRKEPTQNDKKLFGDNLVQFTDEQIKERLEESKPFLENSLKQNNKFLRYIVEKSNKVDSGSNINNDPIWHSFYSEVGKNIEELRSERERFNRLYPDHAVGD